MAVLKYWDETLSQWLPVAPGPKGDKGDKGDTGDLANLDIGTVTTGSPAAAHIDGNFEDGYELDLTLPSVGAGSIHDADVNAAADIAPSKIAGTALTSASMAVFNVKDYGALGDNSHDDTAAIQAAITAAAVTGGEVFIPPGVYKIAGTLTLPAFTKLRGSREEFGAGSNLTVLNFPTKTNNHIGIDALSGSCTIEDLSLRGTYQPYDTTTIGIKARTATFRNVYIAGFYYGMKLYQAYYAVLDRVAFSRNETHLSCEEVYNLNLYGCNFSNEPVYGAAANTALALGTIRSFSMFGGSIEGYSRGIIASSGSGVHLYGVYFETRSDMAAIGVYLGATTGVNLHMTGCTIYLNGHTRFVYAQDGATKTSITSSGNFFCSGDETSNAGDAFSLNSHASSRNYLRGDNWSGVSDPGATYVGAFLSQMAVANSIIEFPVGWDGSGWGPEPMTFQGHHMNFANGAKIIAGQSTGLQIGSLYYEKLGFLGATPVTRQTVTGAKDGNAALGSLITALAAFGLILDSTS